MGDYLSDNPEPPCPIVGLENITEFVTKDGSKRPFYHCSLGGCCQEQGDSRQIFQHLITFHHVITWAKEHSDIVPEKEEELIELCRTLVNRDLNVRTIVSDKLHEKCRRAKIREVDLLSSRRRKAPSKKKNHNNSSKNNKSGSLKSSLTSQNAPTPDDRDPTFEAPTESVDTGEEDRVAKASTNIEVTNQKENVEGTNQLSGDRSVPENEEDNNNTVGDFSVENPTASFFERNENCDLPEIIEFGGPKPPSSMCWINESTLTALKKEEPILAPPVLSLPACFPTYDNNVHTSPPTSLVPIPNSRVGKEAASRRRKKSETLSPFVSYYDSPTFKEEHPRDVLHAVSDSSLTSNNTQIDVANKDPEKVFYEKVVNLVKTNLNRYFAKNSEDKFDKAGKLKVIKIKDFKEYASYCRHFSKKFSKDIKETFELTNGNLEGIEKLSVWEYGLEHDIHKHFSDRPCIE